MGRYLAAGIPVKIEVFKKDRKQLNTEEQKEIREQLERFYNLKNYKETMEEKEGNRYFLTYKMNKKFFNDNIHEAIKEIEDIHDCDSLLEYLFNNPSIPYEDFNQKNYPIKLSEVTKKDKPLDKNTIGEMCIRREDGDYWRNEIYFYSEGIWLFDNYNLKRKYSISMSYILLYLEIDKFDSESESGLLKILNKLRVGYFKDSDNELVKTLTYLIYG